MLASMIIKRPSYDEMAPQEVLSKPKHHECLDEDAINAHNQNPSAIGYNKNVALKATKLMKAKVQAKRRTRK